MNVHTCMCVSFILKDKSTLPWVLPCSIHQPLIHYDIHTMLLFACFHLNFLKYVQNEWAYVPLGGRVASIAMATQSPPAFIISCLPLVGRKRGQLLNWSWWAHPGPTLGLVHPP